MDLKLEDQVKATRALISVKKKSLADLRKCKSQAFRADKDALVEAIKELEGSCVSLQAEAFDHFETLLCTTFQSQRQRKHNVSDECDGDTYVNTKSIVPGVIHGRNLAAIKPCYMLFIELFRPQDSAKGMQPYMATNISINTDIMSVRQGIGRIQELNKLLPYMPCLRHKKDRPPAI